MREVKIKISNPLKTPPPQKKRNKEEFIYDESGLSLESSKRKLR